MSSSKGQPYLELCRFTQVLLKTKVARWKTYFLIGISKRPMCIIRQNGWHITRGMQPKRRVLRLESHCYNKSCPGSTLNTSPRYDDQKPSLVDSDPCLTFLSSACISFTSNQMHSLVCVYHRAITLWSIIKCPPQWCLFISYPCRIDLTRDFVYPSFSIDLRGCCPRPRWWSLLFRSSCTNGRYHPQPRNLGKFFSISSVWSIWWTKKIE
jgi:hypothetical protein